MAARLGAERAGLLFVWFQFGALVPAVAVLFLLGEERQWPLYLFLALVVLSRVGLWGFDLVEVQLMQTRVAPSEAGIVNAAEVRSFSPPCVTLSLRGLFSLCSTARTVC